MEINLLYFKKKIIIVLKIVGFIIIFFLIFSILEYIISRFLNFYLLSQIIFFLSVLISSKISISLFDKKLLRDLGLKNIERNKHYIVMGLILPIITMFLVAFILVVSGNGYYSNDFSKKSMFHFLISIPYFVFVGFNEELLFRGYIFQRLIEGFGKLFSVILLSVLFGLAHYFNPHINFVSLINIVLAGILFSLMYIKTYSLWLPIAFHFSWNFSEGMLFGFPVSGITLFNQFISFHPTGNTFLTGGSFGPEGSLTVTIFLLILIFYFFKKSDEKCEE